MKITSTIKHRSDGTMVYERRYTPDRMYMGTLDRTDYEGYEADMKSLEDMIDILEPHGSIDRPAFTDGDTAILAVYHDIMRDNTGDTLPHIALWIDNGEGVPGNSDRSQCRYHGWRGTTNDTSCRAYGLRKIISTAITGGRAKKLRIVFGRDLAEGKE